MRSKGTTAELEARRRLAVRRVSEGWTRRDVATFLGVHPETVAEWVRAHRTGGDKALAAKPHPGPTPRLSGEQLRELEPLLLQGAKAHGWHNDLWSAHRVAEVIRRRFGVEYHTEHVRKIIRRRLGWSSQVPQKKARQRNDEKIAH